MASNKIVKSSFLRDLSEASCSYKSVPLKRNQSKDILNRVQKTYEKFQEKPLPPVFKTRLDGPSPIWKVFSRLQMAMASTFADSCPKGCMIFAFEDKISDNGQRLFLVAHPEQVWINHRSRQLEERCTYEVIRENYPCKLYFDLEYYTNFNSNKNGNYMTKIFIKCVIASMFDQHNLLLKDSDFLWLDASNDSKFSCHLIVQMKGVAFQNNIHAGTFVTLLISTLRKRIADNASSDDLWPSAEEIKTLLVISKKGNEVFFCDEGVYSRNRNFRMYLSTKHGKKCPLIISSQNKYWPSDPSCKEETIFYDSLITYFRNQDIYKLLSYEQNQTDVSFHLRRAKNKSGVSGCSSSPFPELDNFILKVVTDELAIGFIRKWTYYSKEQKIIYDIGNYRYCGNIGRHHKSNNIRIVVDMKSKYFYQTCLDPECRQEGYQSEITTIFEDVLFANIPDNFFDDDICFSQLQPEEIKGKSNNNGLFCSEGQFDINGNNTYEDNEAENECNKKINNTEAAIINNCFNSISTNDKIYEDWMSSVEDFSELCKLNSQNVKNEYDKIINNSEAIFVSNCFNSTSINDKLCEDWMSSVEDLSELCKINSQNKVIQDETHGFTNEESNFQFNEEPNQDTWDAFFVEDFTCTEDANKSSPELPEKMNEDFSFLNDELFWSSDDSSMDESSVSLEEEILMAEAVEATEATMDANIFSEETVF